MKNFTTKVWLCLIVAWCLTGCSDKNDVAKALETNTVSDFEQRILNRVNSFNSNYIGIKLAPRPDGVELKTNGVAKIKDKNNSKQVTLFPNIGTPKIKIRGEVFLVKNRTETTVLPLVPVFLIEKSRFTAAVQFHKELVKQKFDAEREQIRLRTESQSGFTNSLKLVSTCAIEYKNLWTNFVQNLSKTEFGKSEGRIDYRWRIAKGSKYYTDKNRSDAIKLKQESQNLLVVYERLNTAKIQLEGFRKVYSFNSEFDRQRLKLHDNLIQRLNTESEVNSDTGADGKYELNFDYNNRNAYCVLAVIYDDLGRRVVFSRDLETGNLSGDSVLNVNLSGVHQVLPDFAAWRVQDEYLNKPMWAFKSLIDSYYRETVFEKPEEFDVLFDE